MGKYWLLVVLFTIALTGTLPLSFGQSIQESDLQIVSFSHNFDPSNPASTITFTLVIVNNGPDTLGPGEFTNPAFPHLEIRGLDANSIDWSSCDVSDARLLCITRDVENGDSNDGVFTGVSDFSFTLEPGETITLIGSGIFREITSETVIFTATGTVTENPTTVDPNVANNSLDLELELPQCDIGGTAVFISDWSCVTSFTNQVSCQSGTILQGNDCVIDPVITTQINEQNSLIAHLQNLIQTLNDKIAELEAMISGQNMMYCGLSESQYSVVMRGSEENDNLVGTNFDDLIFGYGGNDKIIGKQGNDCIIGGTGNDVLHGNKGNDNISGGPDNDKIHGGQGDDIIDGGDGTGDKCKGGQGTNSVASCEISDNNIVEEED